MTAPRSLPLPHISERDFQSQVIDLAHLYRWRVAHFRPAQTRSGRWVTPVQADGAGFPDLVMVRGHRMVAAELKSDKGRTSESQLDWLAAFGHVPGIEACVWRPGDWDRIVEWLR